MLTLCSPCGNSQLLGISMCGAALEDPKSTSVQENVPTVHYEYVMKENMCLTCKKKWTDIFTLTDVEEDDD